MFNDRWKPLTRVDPSGGSRKAQAPPSQRPVQAPPRGLESKAAKDSSACSRHSNGLDQFFAQLHGRPGLSVLDLSGASQANIGFITSLGHKLYSDDFLQTLDLAFGEGDFYANQSMEERAHAFIEQSLNFPENHFDGVLAWDVLEFLAPPLLKLVVDRLFLTMKPQAYLFAMFHAEERAEAIPAYYYRIADAKTILLSFRANRAPAQFFNNRAVEKLFQSFEAVKFFLTRDALREVIVKR